ncbi:hypothetical protein F8M41_012525 [Gigaspora margarita]|uniref:Uncharacterized protein n=1 Tax=Gigaspora margarita TaxID=4874 RepID=A0A8H4ASY8_GIGMA|nr:hypothetical protein F8M41_012525 [Gigaspora margarita]
MNALKSSNKNILNFNEDSQIDFNRENEAVSSEDDDEVESNIKDEIESNKENEEIFETKSVEIVGQIFATKKDILNIVQEIARSSGFAVTTKSSGNRHFDFQCKRGGQPQKTSNLTVDTRQKKENE